MSPSKSHFTIKPNRARVRLTHTGTHAGESPAGVRRSVRPPGGPVNGAYNHDQGSDVLWEPMPRVWQPRAIHVHLRAVCAVRESPIGIAMLGKASPANRRGQSAPAPDQRDCPGGLRGVRVPRQWRRPAREPSPPAALPSPTARPSHSRPHAGGITGGGWKHRSFHYGHHQGSDLHRKTMQAVRRPRAVYLRAWFMCAVRELRAERQRLDRQGIRVERSALFDGLNGGRPPRCN
jgi:hypothetical protein